MATSSAMNTSNQFVKYKITVTQNSQNITNNTSNVTVSVKFYRTNTGYETYGNGTVYCKIDGTTYSTLVTSSQKITSSGIILFTKTLNIKHNTNGAKNLLCSAWINHDVITSNEQSYSQTLTTIPRKSTLSAGNGTLGVEQTLTITRQATGFTHTVIYKCGSVSGTICSKSKETSIQWIPPLALAAQNTSGVRVSVILTITTYNGSNSIGSNTKTITCFIPASVKPSCGLTVSDATGYASIYDGYIKGLSKLRVEIKGTAAYGSEISSCRTTTNDAVYTANSFTTDVLKSSGLWTVNTLVTDKRGRSDSASVNLTVLDYSVPLIHSLTVKRCNADGSENDQGSYIQILFSADVTSLNNKNNAEYTLRYKKTSDTNDTSLSILDLKDIYSVSDYTMIIAADTESSYDVVLVVTDNFGSTEKSAKASTAFTLMHWAISGLAVAFGKVCELGNYWLDIALNTMFRKSVYMARNTVIYGMTENGMEKEALNPQDAAGNTNVGMDNYKNKSGITAIYGHDVTVGVSNVDGDSLVYRPYFRKGDQVSVTLRTSGFVTGGSANVSFVIPIAKPVIGNPVVTVQSGNGFVLRQNGAYTHGSSGSMFVKPASYSAALYQDNCVVVIASFNNTANVTNNAALGIQWDGTVIFS